MPYEIVNKLRGPSVIKIVDALARTTINLSQLSAFSQTENVIGATISSVKWSLDPTSGATAGKLSIDRQVAGQAAVPVLNVYQTGTWGHDDFSQANTATGNLNITLTSGGMAVIVLSKDAVYNVSTQGL